MLRSTLSHNVQVIGLGVISFNSNSVGSGRQGVPVTLSATSVHVCSSGSLPNVHTETKQCTGAVTFFRNHVLCDNSSGGVNK